MPSPTNIPTPRAPAGRPEHLANLTHPPLVIRARDERRLHEIAIGALLSAPRIAGERMKTSAQTTNIAVSESLEFDSSTNAVYGNATHAYARTTPSCLPAAPSRSRVPSTYIPHVVSASNASAAACAAGRSSQRPWLGQIHSNGM